MKDKQKTAYQWHFLTDYSENELKDSHVQELDSLVKVWFEQRKTLEDKGLINGFLQRLKRKWAIETGVIENIYTLDRGVTQALIENGIVADQITHEATNQSPAFVACMIQDQLAVVDGLFDFIKNNRKLSTGYIKEINAALCRNQKTTAAVDQFGNIHDIALTAGEYKQHPNSPTQPDGRIHEYCPPEQVASEMDMLVCLHQKHVQEQVSPLLEAAWLHHRFVQIHPFQDGNGRVARALASLVFIRAGWFPLAITRNERTEYLDALEYADMNDLTKLIALFAKVQKNTFVAALGLASQEVQNSAQVNTVIDRIREKLIIQKNGKNKVLEKAMEYANELISLTQTEMDKHAATLKGKLGMYLSDFMPYSDCAIYGNERDYYFRKQVVDTANQLDYFADLSTFRAWSRLVLPGKIQLQVLVSAHGIGYEYRGVIVFSACCFTKSLMETSQMDTGEIQPLSNELFQVNYLDDYEMVKERFQLWLNDIVVKALAQFSLLLEK